MKKDNMDTCSCGCQSPTDVVQSIEWPQKQGKIFGCSCSDFQGQDALIDFVRLLREENRKLRKQCEEMRTFIKRISTQESASMDDGFGIDAEVWKKKYEGEKFQKLDIARKFKNLKAKIKKMIEIKATLEQQQKDTASNTHVGNDMNILHCNNHLPQENYVEKECIVLPQEFSPESKDSEFSSNSFSSHIDFVDQFNGEDKCSNDRKVLKSVLFSGVNNSKRKSLNANQNDKNLPIDTVNNYFFKSCKSYTNFDSVSLENEMFTMPVLVPRFAS